MNDLFSSSSFKKYQDLKKQVEIDDMEAGTAAGGGGGGGGENETVDLDKFFEDVENVKRDMKGVESLHKSLQEANEECKTAHNAKTMKDLRSRMDADVSKVLKHVKVIKGKLEALERSNAASRQVQGCGPGSSADRTRTAVVSGLGKKLKDMMDDFQNLRAKMNSEYKETVARRYYTVTGEQPDDDLIDNLISSGESESFLQKAIQEQGRGQILDTISEIQERHDAVKEIEKNLIELHQIFLDMAALVEAQGQQLNSIESHVAHASSFVRRGTEQLQEAHEIQKESRKCTCIAIILVIVLIIVLLFPIWSNLLMIHLR
nr:syntaxin-124-like [Ipomoea batatas]